MRLTCLVVSFIFFLMHSTPEELRCDTATHAHMGENIVADYFL